MEHLARYARETTNTTFRELILPQGDRQRALLKGMEMRELSTANYGPDRRWLPLDKVPKVPGSEGGSEGA